MIKKFKYALILSAFVIFSAVNSNFCAAAVQFGDRGAEVAEVQRCLIAQELFSGEIDGYCGESTVNAIKEFQSAVGLYVDGICGAETFALLHAAAYNEIDITELMTGAPISRNILKPGDTGERVRSMQNKLADLGFYHSSIDGVYGSGTTAAVKSFQYEQGLNDSGICNVETLNVLNNLTGGGDFEIYEEPANYNFQRSIYVEATAYSIYDAGLNARTATGNRVRRGVIAVDPNVIPLGTRVYIPGYGEAVADDTGGEIIGNKIDIAFDSYEEAMDFGRRFIEIYIISD